MSTTALSASPSGASQNPNLGLNRLESAALVVGIVIAHLFFFRNLALPLSYDDSGYAEAGRDILENGLFSNFHESQIRTYAYPLFLSLPHWVSDLTGAPFRGTVFALHLLIYFSAAAFLRVEIGKLKGGGAGCVLRLGP